MWLNSHKYKNNYIYMLIKKTPKRDVYSDSWIKIASVHHWNHGSVTDVPSFCCHGYHSKCPLFTKLTNIKTLKTIFFYHHIVFNRYVLLHNRKFVKEKTLYSRRARARSQAQRRRERLHGSARDVSATSCVLRHFGSRPIRSLSEHERWNRDRARRGRFF